MRKQKMLLTAAFTAGLVIIGLLIGCNVFVELKVDDPIPYNSAISAGDIATVSFMY